MLQYRKEYLRKYATTDLRHGHFGGLVDGEKGEALGVPVGVDRLVASEVPQAVDQFKTEEERRHSVLQRQNLCTEPQYNLRPRR